MKPDTLGIVMFQTIIELFIVAEVESLLLQLPLQVPIGLGHEQEPGESQFNGPDHFGPIVGRWAGSRPGSPGPLEDAVHEKHGHIAADAVALAGHIRKGFNHCLPEARLKGVQLQNIRPGREVGVSAAGKHLSSRLEE